MAPAELNLDLLQKIIFEVANEFNQSLKHKIDVHKNLDAGLYGPEGVLDSISLVSFVIAVEQAIQDQCGIPVSLSDENALSQKRSPFQTMGTLLDYIEERIRSS
jgi:acyl carrier protein